MKIFKTWGYCLVLLFVTQDFYAQHQELIRTDTTYHSNGEIEKIATFCRNGNGEKRCGTMQLFYASGALQLIHKY